MLVNTIVRTRIVLLSALTILTLSFVGSLAVAPAGLAQPNGAKPLTASATAREQQVEDTLSRISSNSVALQEFFTELPKGADLHQHLSGTVYAESLLAWAAEDGLCIDQVTYVASPPPCTSTQSAAASLLSNPVAQSQVIANWSMRMFVPTNTFSGHDHFFATFGKFNSVLNTPGRTGDALAEALSQAAADSVLRIETKLSPNASGSSRLAQALVESGSQSFKDPARFSEAMALLTSAGLDEVARESTVKTDELVNRSNAVLACGTPAPLPGCQVNLGLVAQINRNSAPANVFAGLATGFATAAIDSRWVAVDLVSPEDGLRALNDYVLHMEMVRFFRSLYPQVKVTLHAGEFVPGTVPAPAMRSHINEAVFRANADRIGHGVSIRSAQNAQALLRHMRERGVTVEISLTSNEQILGVKAAASQFPIYLSAGVPVVLSTDDAGVARTDLTREYVKAFRWFDLTYRELKDLSYQSIDSAFVSQTERKRLIRLLDARFTAFEQEWARSNAA
jgi:adenosine deaminase